MQNLGKRFNPLKLAKSSWKYGSFVYVFLFMFIIYISMLPVIRIGSIMNILTHTAVIGTIALGMGLIIISGEIDLSVGSTFAFSGGLGILAYNDVLNSTGNHGLAMFVCLLVCIVLSSFVGFINGILVGKIKIPAFITTLGTMLIFRSLCKWILKAIPSETGGQQQTYQVKLYYESPLYTMGNEKLGVVPIVGIILIALTLIVFYIAKYTKFGRRVYALGSNVKASSLAGINVPWTKVAIFTIAGLLVGLAVFLHIGIYSSIDSSSAGISYELYAIASCVIGGIAMTGGKGNIIGILFGAMSFQIIDKIISVANLNPLINDAIKGSILLLAVILQVVVIDKSAFVKYLQHIGLLYSINRSQDLDGTLRRKVNNIKLTYDKKLQKVLSNNKITQEEADILINKLLDERESKIVKLNKIYLAKIDNANLKAKVYARNKAIKEIKDAKKDEILQLKTEQKLAIKNTKKENPKLLKNLLELKKVQIAELEDKNIEAENEIFKLVSDVEVLKDNAEHILQRDSEVNEEKANQVYTATISKIDAKSSKDLTKHEALINKFITTKENTIKDLDEKLEANIPLENDQIIANEEALKLIEEKEAIKEAKRQQKLDIKNAKLEKEKLEADEAKRRQEYLESIYAKRGMH